MGKHKTEDKESLLAQTSREFQCTLSELIHIRFIKTYFYMHNSTLELVNFFMLVGEKKWEEAIFIKIL